MAATEFITHDAGKLMAPIMPIYYQIKETIRDWIISGEYPPGAKMPSENELSERFKVSRLTLRRALAMLTQEGLLTSHQGEGTFVTDNQELISSYSLEFSGFMDDLFYQISKSHTKSVKREKIKPSRYVLDKLQMAGEPQEVVYIHRVRYLRDKSFAVTDNYIPLPLGGKINADALYHRSMLQMIEQDLKVEFTEAFQTIEASFANQQISEELEIPSGSPVLFVERVMYGKGGKPVEFVRTWYRGDLYKYVVRLKAARGRHGSVWVNEGQ